PFTVLDTPPARPVSGGAVVTGLACLAGALVLFLFRIRPRGAPGPGAAAGRAAGGGRRFPGLVRLAAVARTRRAGGPGRPGRGGRGPRVPARSEGQAPVRTAGAATGRREDGAGPDAAAPAAGPARPGL